MCGAGKWLSQEPGSACRCLLWNHSRLPQTQQDVNSTVNIQLERAGGGSSSKKVMKSSCCTGGKWGKKGFGILEPKMLQGSTAPVGKNQRSLIIVSLKSLFQVIVTFKTSQILEQLATRLSTDPKIFGCKEGTSQTLKYLHMVFQSTPCFLPAQTHHFPFSCAIP